MKVRLKRLMMIALLVSVAPLSFGKPVTYVIDPNHTFPAFEADHMGGLSLWRGKINSTSGEIILDKKNRDRIRSLSSWRWLSIDFGHDEMNKRAKSDDMFDIEEFPQASYEGTLINFQDGVANKSRGRANATWHY